MKKLINYFELNKKYNFEWSDITSVFYVICVCGIMMGFNMTPLFVCVCLVSLITCIRAKRLNLIVINLAFVILNIYYLLA